MADLTHVRDLLEQAYAELAEITNAAPAAAQPIANGPPRTTKEKVDALIRQTPPSDEPTTITCAMCGRQKIAGILCECGEGTHQVYGREKVLVGEMDKARQQIAAVIDRLHQSGLATTTTLEQHLKEKRRRR